MSEIEMSRVDREIAGIQSGQSSVYTSITGDSQESRLANFSAISNSTPIADHLGETIALRHVVIQSVDMPEEKTGEIIAVPRVILVDDSGNAFHAISSGLMTSIRNLFAFVGTPDTWSAPIPVKVTEARGRSGHRYYTLSAA